MSTRTSGRRAASVSSPVSGQARGVAVQDVGDPRARRRELLVVSSTALPFPRERRSLLIRHCAVPPTVGG